MIEEVILKNVAGYKDGEKLKTDKKINVIYGLNGTGKTQFSRVLEQYGKLDSKFKDCKIKGLSDEKILVYNQDFVDKNFSQSETQEGIFTLSNENIEIEKEIKKLENDKKALGEKRGNNRKR